MPVNTSSGEQKLSMKQQRLITALCSGHTITAAARIADCNEKTAHIWLKQTHVQAAYQEAQNEMFSQALKSLLHVVEDAVKTLKTIMIDQDQPASARIRAAQILLEQAIEIHKVSDLEAKIAELEQAVKE